MADADVARSHRRTRLALQGATPLMALTTALIVFFAAAAGPGPARAHAQPQAALLLATAAATAGVALPPTPIADASLPRTPIADAPLPRTPIADAPLVASFAAAPPSGRYAFVSWSPPTLAALAQGRPAGAPIVHVGGQLFLPPGSGQGPALVLVHGSGGPYRALFDFWVPHFNAAGYAVFVLDMFGPRGVKSTVQNQAAVPFAADVADAFAALRLLATHPRIDAKRIAIMGFSRGGMAALRTDVGPIISAQHLPDGLRYAAVVALYSGGCSGGTRLRVKPGVFAQAPILFVHGDADDYAPIVPCRDYAAEIRQAGTPVEFVTLLGAGHKFDSDNQRRRFLPTATRTEPDCPLETDIETGFVHDRHRGTRLQGAALAQVRQRCRGLGAHVQGDRQAREQAALAVIGFLKRTFGP